VLKIRAAVNNARCFMQVQEEFGSFSTYIWGFVWGKPKQNKLVSMKDITATTTESDLLAKDLKKRGFKFLGSTTVYAHMQATGLVNDHLESCFRNSEVMSLE
jgi:DNA-3-methyladenine glycosylase I